MSLIIALVAGVAIAPAPTADASVASASRPTLTALVDRVAVHLDQFWRDVARRKGFPYTRPRVHRFRSSQPVRSACGLHPIASHAYCSRDHTIYLDVEVNTSISLDAFWRADMDFAVVTIMAHEIPSPGAMGLRGRVCVAPPGANLDAHHRPV